MAVARVVNLVTGILSVFILIKTLGMDLFAAWAVLLGGGAAFAALDPGMPLTVIRFVSEASGHGDRNRVDSILTNVYAITLIAYGIGFCLLHPFSACLAGWLKLPATQWFSAGTLLTLTYGMVAARALMNPGVATLYALSYFREVAIISFLQAFLSNTFAWGAAILTGRLELVLISYWGTQAVVVFIANRFARHLVRWRITPSHINLATIKKMLMYGLRVQLNEWMLFFNFQYNKMMLAGWVGLAAVAPYELANRGGMALRSIPSSGLDTVMPKASVDHAQGVKLWPCYLNSLKIGINCAILFLVIPATVAPLFMHALGGTVGVMASSAFIIMIAGIIINILALPAKLLLQAMSLEKALVKTSLLTILMNIALTLLFVTHWGVNGAAAASAIAMLTGGIWITGIFHSHMGMRMTETMRNHMRKLWPILIVCPVWMAAAFFIQPLLPPSQLCSLAASGILYAICAACLYPFLFMTGWYRLSDQIFLWGRFQFKLDEPDECCLPWKKQFTEKLQP